ncbi:AraC family transcriptional regulator [Rhodocytophaga aerolata]
MKWPIGLISVSLPYFSKAFKEYFSQSPSEYRLK